MPSDADTAEILAELAALREIVRPKRRHPARHRPYVILACTDEEKAAIEAAAAERACNVSDLLRTALEPVLQRALPRNRIVPINLAAHNRRKPISDHAAQNVTLNRADAARTASRLAVAAKQALRDYHATVQEAPVMIGQTAPVPIVPKLPKAGG